VTRTRSPELRRRLWTAEVRDQLDSKS